MLSLSKPSMDRRADYKLILRLVHIKRELLGARL